MRHCKNCGATEKEVMLQIVTYPLHLDTDKGISLVLDVDTDMCINCIYNSKKFPINYGTAGELSTEDLEDFTTSISKGFAKKLREGLVGYKKEPFDTLIGIEFTNRDGSKTFSKSTLAQSHVEYGRAIAERDNEDIKQESVNVGKVLGWKIE